ncbi:shikimate dehydrogenase family protein [Cellulophaga omnivescoria]|uniref:shikimate dehydrogenase family protein n=1 Tax=Cellulophaga omnivescoria TaxID=1888890 RepID=UPI0009864760|nr:shikimate dehydrogenase [Cellulophaga omnivescoria]WBU89692.1 shikimate dehydrogenase [Cellulophaga omnivescoria]
MEKTEKQKYKYGLIGKDIEYSFSRNYFTQKFKKLGLSNCVYVNFDYQNINEFKTTLKNNTNIKGCNVTIPYKQSIIPFLTSLDAKAKAIGAVNTIKFTENGLIGYNTDAYGFKKSIEPHLKKHHKRALILGTGGASKAVKYVLEELDIICTYVSRSPKENQFTYAELSSSILKNHTVIVNCTPLGTHPNITDKPAIPYQYLTKEHLLFDLIYNPDKTAFLSAGEKQGAAISNGQHMLEYQAEESWRIWNS